MVISCFQRNDQETYNIDTFESILGSPETEYLNEIVTDFEEYLDNNYHNQDISSEYKSYLSDIYNNSLTNKWKIDSIKMLKYNKSYLFSKYDSIYADTVWFENEMVNYILEDDDLIQSLIPINRGNKEINIDSIIEDTKTRPFPNFVSASRFYIALDSIAEKDAFLSEFMKTRTLLPNRLPNVIFARFVLKRNPDYSDYFVKRIIAIETMDSI